MAKRTGAMRRAIVMALGSGATALTAAFAGTATAADILPPVVVAAPMVVEPESVPRFYATASLLYMTRTPPAEQPILTNIPSVSGRGTTEVQYGMDASDYRFGWSLGTAGRIGYGGDPVGFDLGGFWLAPLEAAVTMDGGGFDYLLETRPDLIQVEIDGIDVAEGLDTLRLRGADANVTFALGDGFHLYAGAAYVSLRDALEILFVQVDNPEPEILTWTASNRMIGPQLGMRADFGGDRVGFGFDFRAAYLFNTAGATIAAAPNPVFGDDDTVKARSVMLAGGIDVGFHVTDALSLTLGYQAMWFRNVALAPNQVATTIPFFFPSDAEVDTGFGNLLVHGVTAGLNLTF